MIPLAKPYFDETEHLAVGEVLNSGMVSQGKMVEEFEEKVRKYTGNHFAVAVSSCTAGLYLILERKRGKWGTTWITSAFTFPAVHQIRDKLEYDDSPGLLNCDINKETYNMNTMELKNLIHEDTNCIIPIHQFGLPCNMDEIRKIAQERDLSVVEDAACALGSLYHGDHVGRRGTAVFSFHGRKIITTGEGGMVVTDNEDLYEAVLRGRQFGRKDARSASFGRGVNFKMSDIQAAIGCAQMKKIDDILCLRSFVAKTYKHMITKSDIYDKIRIPTDTKHDGHNWQSYVIRLTGEVNRDNVIKQMMEHEIECQVGSYDNSQGKCPVSAELARTTLALPIWPGMTREQCKYVVNTLAKVISNGPTKTPQI